MACDAHSEAAHSDLERHRSLTDRKFDVNDYDSNEPIETDWGRRAWTFLCCPHYSECPDHGPEHEAHKDAIVIAVDGACRRNGRFGAQAAAGVFFHENNSHWNQSLVLGDEYGTSQRCELRAATIALGLATSIRQNNARRRDRNIGPPGPLRMLRRVVIKSDSAYLVNGMTWWIHAWRRNGFLDSRRRPVKNADMFSHLDEVVRRLNNMNVQVQFWHVPRESNELADCFANAALDGVNKEDALDEFFAGLR